MSLYPRKTTGRATQKPSLAEEFGGGGADLRTTAKAQGIIARGCASTALCSNMHIFGLGSAAEAWHQGDRAAAPIFQLVSTAAEIELLLRPAEALVEDGLRRREQGELLSPEQINTIKYVAVNNAADAVDRCFRMVGGHGLFRKLPLERHYRDVRAGQFHPPSNDVALETIGKAVLGIAPEHEPRWPCD